MALLLTSLLHSKDHGGPDSFSYHLRRRSDRVFELPLPKHQKVCGCSEGWIIIFDEITTRITLFHPDEEVQIQLPRLSSSSSSCSYVSASRNRVHVHKAILSYSKMAASSSSSATQQNDYKVVVIQGESQSLMYYQKGSKEWTSLEKHAGHDYTDAVFYRGQLYAVDERGKVIYYDMFADKMEEISRPWFFDGNKVYIVFIGHALHLIIRYTLEDYEFGYSTQDFGVYAFQVNKYRDWREVDTLGSWALFFGHNTSVAVDTQRTTMEGIIGESIYFTDDCAETTVINGYGALETGHDIGKFSYGDGEITWMNEIATVEEHEMQTVLSRRPMWRFTSA